MKKEARVRPAGRPPLALPDVSRQEGWICEPHGSEIHQRPAAIIVPLVAELERWQLPAAARTANAAVALRPVALADEAALVDLFTAAFTGTIEYTGQRPKDVRASATRFMARTFRYGPGPCPAASQLALLAGAPRGMLLLRQVPCGTLVDLICVHPTAWRQGLAARLTARVVEDLRQAGEIVLYSTAMLGNEASLAWHQACGFEELPDLRVAAHRAAYYRAEWERCRPQGSAAGVAALERQARHWEDEHRKLRALAAQSPEAASPGLLLHG